ncbi:hypothetical protein [Bifidobacterium phasiani]|uniref:Zinc finger protein n=1 Tax=Bifidobacterium phasiani TaxID=2834431 RepID=A0ABS6W679_9BIFI|nr:hypothetical protein [Bifidobacterium phasiani]MBW3081993.1 hypothetical protein [Bifidobacterium phasiani]
MYFCLSDGFHRAPQVESLSMAARGLFATLASWVGGELYETPGYDRTFDKRRVRMLGGTPKQLRELADTGLIAEVSDGVWRINESRRVGGFDPVIFKNPDKVRAGRKGGLASHGARSEQDWETASSGNEADREAEPKQNKGSASNLLQADNQADGEQTAGTSPSRTQADDESASGSASNLLGVCPNPQVAGTISSPNPSQPPGQAAAERTATMDELEARILADPLAAIAGAYPKGRVGRRDQAETAWESIAGSVDPRRMLGAAIRYTRACDQDPTLRRQTPSLAKWLTQRRWEEWLPEPTPTPVIRRHEHSWNCEHVQQAMKGRETQYSHERQGYAPSEWMTACQDYADKLNQTETTKETR